VKHKNKKIVNVLVMYLYSSQSESSRAQWTLQQLPR